MDLSKENYCVNAKSVVGVLSSDIARPISLVIHEDNESEVNRIINALSEYIVQDRTPVAM